MRITYANRILLLGFLIACPAFGQKPAAAPPPASPAAQAPPEDALGRLTPYGTVVGFMRAVETGEMTRAAEYLDSNAKAPEKKKLAEQLGLVLNRAMKLEFRTLSKEPSGKLDDNLRRSRELVGVATMGSDSLDIYLSLIEKPNQASIWLFSPVTLTGIPRMAEQIEGPWQEKYLPRVLVEHYFLSIQHYRWIGAPLLLLLIYLGTGILTWLLGLLLRPLVDRLVGYREGRKIEFANVGPVRMLLVALTIQALTDLPATALARHSWETVATVLMVVSIAWILVRLLRVGIIAAAVRMEHRKTPEKIAMAYLTGRLLQILVGLSATLIVLHIAGVELTGVFAGLGLGGIALALAAQKTLENFLGGVMVIGDAPVRVGDFCKVGEHQGTIEDIGLRSTRIRTMDRTLVHIPNALLSAVSLENFAGRDKIRFLHTLGLQRETTADQLRRIIDESQQMLSAHSRVETESARIRFIKVGVSSLDIEVLVYVLETDFTAFLAVQEDLLLRIMDIVESCGARLALPSQRMYDSGNWDHPSDAKFQPEPTGREVARG